MSRSSVTPTSTGTTDPWHSVIGQNHAIAQLQAAVPGPVHAYLLVGPSGSGGRGVARAFAAALLSHGLEGDDRERAIRLALAERHADLHVFERVGPYITVGQAEAIVKEASRSSVEGDRKVLVLVDFHLVQAAGPVLLKSIEEPPPGVVFVVLAEFVPPELVPIASRCVPIRLEPVPEQLIADALAGEGATPAIAAEIAAAVGGDLDRARLLATDERFSLRRNAWRSVPTGLDGAGATVVRLVGELRAMIDDAQQPLEVRHTREVEELDARAQQYGERGSGRRELTERQKRELRRLRTDELRFGLATLAGAYRDAIAAGVVDGAAARRAVAALDAIHDANEALIRNPTEGLLLQALFLRLPALPHG